jgi:phosphoglycerate dehydrogenase-like enzyme
LKQRLRPAAERVLALVGNNGAGGSAWNDLRGQTVALVGWGQIARRFAELLKPFECRLLVASEHAAEEDLRAFGARRASLGEAFAASKVISLHKGLNEKSRGLIGGELLAMIPKGSVFVNTARAGLVDERALLDRARQGDFALALDVFAQEPLPRRHPLRRLSNVILTPHSAGSTPQCAQRVGEQALAILLDWVDGRRVPALDARRLAEMT